MRYIYKNITAKSVLLSLASENKHSVSHVPIGPSSTIELSYPGLDLYLPHILARMNESGIDITHLVLRASEDAKVAAEKANVKVEPKKQVFSESQTSEVKPGIYVEKEASAPVVKEVVKEVEPEVKVVEPVKEPEVKVVEAPAADPVAEQVAEKAASKKRK